MIVADSSAWIELLRDTRRACRSGGETIRKMADCLVAVPVIEAGASLLHHDGDFDALARHSALRVEPVPG